MSVSFQGHNDSLNLNNGLASRLLAAMDLPINSTAGETDISTMPGRITTAKTKVSGEDLPYLQKLEDLVTDLTEAGATKLEWF